jgi:hypothetical protein
LARTIFVKLNSTLAGGDLFDLRKGLRLKVSVSRI